MPDETEQRLIELLSDDVRAQWRSREEFLTYINEIYYITGQSRELIQQARLRGNLFIDDESLRGGYKTLQNEMSPIASFIKNEFSEEDAISLRCLGGTQEPDAELDYNGDTIELEVTLANFNQYEREQMRLLNERGITDINGCDPDEAVGMAEEKIRGAVENKYNNNQNCWLIVEFDDTFIDMDSEGIQGLKQKLLAHGGEWLEHFSRITIIGNPCNFYLTIHRLALSSMACI
ncbi:MAG: hypothetical protein ACPG80_02560, partial [Rickettsiales bacterium]